MEYLPELAEFDCSDGEGGVTIWFLVQWEAIQRRLVSAGLRLIAAARWLMLWLEWSIGHNWIDVSKGGRRWIWFEFEFEFETRAWIKEDGTNEFETDEFMKDWMEQRRRRGCMKKKWNEEEEKRICEEESGTQDLRKEEDKTRGIFVFLLLFDKSRGIFVHSRAYELISSATSSD